MCDRIRDLRCAIEQYARDFDPAVITPADASRVVTDMAAVEKIAAAVKVMAAARVADTDVWGGGGEKSAAHQLAKESGVSVGAAVEALTVGRRMQTQPHVAAAVRAGRLSTAQAAEISDAAAVNPAVEEQLVDAAGRLSLRELRSECAHAKAAGIDLEERRRQIHQARSLRSYTDRDGAGHLHLRDNPERIAEIMNAITPIRDRIFRQARREQHYEPIDAYAADALIELTHSGDPANGNGDGTRRRSSNHKIIVRVDLPSLLRGYPTDGEVCEIVGYGPIAVSAVRDMIDTRDPFLAAVITDGEQITGVAHLGRQATAKQQTALEWLFPACAAEGCPSVAFLETDHRIDWAKLHLTVFDLLDRPCKHHHYLKTVHDWAFVDGTGKRPMVPPDDPRHPKHAPANAHAPPGAV